MDVNLATESDILQSVVIISDGFNLSDEDCQKTYTMLKNFTEINMAFVFGIFPNGTDDRFFKNGLEYYSYNYSFNYSIYLFNNSRSNI